MSDSGVRSGLAMYFATRAAVTSALPIFRSQLKAVMAADGATSFPGLGINPALTQVSLMSSRAAVRTAASSWEPMKSSR